MSGHTPGPLEVRLAPPEGTAYAEYMESLRNAKGHVFVVVAPLSEMRSDGTTYLVTAVTGDGPHAESNALLYAAAPDLLAALKSVEWSGEDHDRDDSWPACPSCGAPSAEVGIEPPEATRDAHPGVHSEGCVLAAALAKAESR